MVLIVGNKYKWKHENIVLVYVGKSGPWHQFSKDDGIIWCEVLDSDLRLMESVE